jgi:hypothetical protein
MHPFTQLNPHILRSVHHAETEVRRPYMCYVVHIGRPCSVVYVECNHLRDSVEWKREQRDD